MFLKESKLGVLSLSLALDLSNLLLDLSHELLGQGIEVHCNQVADPANHGSADEAGHGDPEDTGGIRGILGGLGGGKADLQDLIYQFVR